MKANELFDQVLTRFPEIPNNLMHPLHKAILEECCENAVEQIEDTEPEETLIRAVMIAFLTCESTLRGTLKAALEINDADQITLNYREQSFVIPKESPLITNSNSNNKFQNNV